MTAGVALIGAGFVADLYLRSLRLYPDLPIRAVYDRRPERTQAFCAHWDLKAVDSFEALLDALEPGDVVLNLTNPSEHYAVSRACLEAGHHVYSEKPLAMTLPEAEALVALADARGLSLTSAPCNGLSETAQTLWAAVREDVAGRVPLVYAEMDDDFIPQAPYRDWISDSGAPWPFEDEFRVGCTLEHAGYYLTWLLPMFGPVRTVVAASARLAGAETLEGEAAPDFSVGTLFFASGTVARLTCSILAPHNHAITLVGEGGLLQVKECWNNTDPVKFRRRFRVRRRLVTHPIGRRVRLPGPTHPTIGRKGAAAMNFALGPVEMIDALREDRRSRLPSDMALHMTEVTLALQSAGETAGAQTMTTTFQPPEPMPWARALKS